MTRAILIHRKRTSSKTTDYPPIRGCNAREWELRLTAKWPDRSDVHVSCLLQGIRFVPLIVGWFEYPCA